MHVCYPLIDQFKSWLTINRGLRETTISLYTDLAFYLIRSLGTNPSTYTAKGIRDFVYKRAGPHGKWRAQGITTCTRAYLRFLGVMGLCSLKTRHEVTHTVNSAIARAKLNTTQRGAHILRHSAATAMLKEGVPLQSISNVLRHRQSATTSIYAKVDIKTLSKIAQPWMGV